jgi:hypothetical protein
MINGVKVLCSLRKIIRRCAVLHARYVIQPVPDLCDVSLAVHVRTGVPLRSLSPEVHCPRKTTASGRPREESRHPSRRMCCHILLARSEATAHGMLTHTVPRRRLRCGESGLPVLNSGLCARSRPQLRFSRVLHDSVLCYVAYCQDLGTTALKSVTSRSRLAIMRHIPTEQAGTIDPQSFWGSGLCPSSGILKTIEHIV